MVYFVPKFEDITYVSTHQGHGENYPKINYPSNAFDLAKSDGMKNFLKIISLIINEKTESQGSSDLEES